jgi:hypothetical protein
MFSIPVLTFAFILPVSVFALEAKVLKPTKNGTFDVGIIITPGADIAGEAYEQLGMSISSYVNRNLFIY